MTGERIQFGIEFLGVNYLRAGNDVVGVPAVRELNARRISLVYIISI